MVLKDSPIQKVEDLKGKVVATNAAGSAVDVAMKAMLHKHGLEPNRDYTVIEAPFPAMKAMLAEHKVDIIPAVVPFSYDPELRNMARDLFVQKDAIGITDMIVWTARKPFIDKNRAALVDFFEDTLIITRWYLDPKNHAETMEIAGRVTKRPPQALRLAVHQQGLLPRPRHAAEPRRAAEERRSHPGAGLRQRQGRRQGVRGSQHGPGGGEAAEVTAQCIDLPPSTLMVWPVMKSLAGDDKNITAPTRSAGTWTRSMARPATREAR